MLQKALTINRDPLRYGSFAEIGAGQEVARQFFVAGLASKTVAKTMSAYDMKFSDAIYGREADGRYVCLSRLQKMLDQEYQLLQERLQDSRGPTTCFFSFANTVTTSSTSNRSHGYMGVKYQSKPNTEPSQIVIHVWMKDRFRLDQQQVLGDLGLNLIFGAFYLEDDPVQLVASLTDQIKSERLDIDYIHFSGPAFAELDNRVVNLELVRKNLTQLIIFDPQGAVAIPSDIFYQRVPLIQRGTFRPFQPVHDLLFSRAKEVIQKTTLDPIAICEINTSELFAPTATPAGLETDDYLGRIDAIHDKGYPVLVSNYPYFFQLKEHLRRFTSQHIAMALGLPLLEKLFSENIYDKSFSGGVASALGRLLDDDCSLYVFPELEKDKVRKLTPTRLERPSSHLLDYWIDRQKIIELDP